MSNPYTNYPPDQNPQNQPGYGQQQQDPYAPDSGSNTSDPYAQSAYQQQSAYVAQPAYPLKSPSEPGSGMAIAGLVLGIVSIPTAFFLGCGGIVGIVGIIMSVLGRRAPSKRTLAMVGLILSIVGIVVAIGYWVFIFALAASAGNSSY